MPEAPVQGVSNRALRRYVEALMMSPSLERNLLLKKLPRPSREQVIAFIKRHKAALGEYVGNPEYFQTAPPAADPALMFTAEIKSGVGARPVPMKKREIIEEDGLPIVRTIPPVGRRLLITAVELAAGDPRRIDTGMAHRVSIMIRNTSIIDIWVNTTSAVQPSPALGQLGSGMPVAGCSAVGAWDGQAITVQAGPEIEFWAVPDTGSSRWIIVAEMAR